MISLRFTYDGEHWDECAYPCSAAQEGKFVQKNICREGETNWGTMDFLDATNNICVKVADGIYALSEVWENNDSWACQDSCRNGACNVEAQCYTEFDQDGNCVYPEESGYYECTKAYEGVNDSFSCGGGPMICHMELNSEGIEVSVGQCPYLCTEEVGATRVKQDVCTTDTLSDITETCIAVGSKKVWLPTKSDNKAKCKNGCGNYSSQGCDVCGEGECVYFNKSLYSVESTSNWCQNYKDGSFVPVNEVSSYYNSLYITCLEPCDPSEVGTKVRSCTDTYANENRFSVNDFVCTKIGDSYVWVNEVIERCDYGCGDDGVTCRSCSAEDIGQVIWSHCGGSYNNYTVIDDVCVRDGYFYDVKSSVVDNCKYGCTENAGVASCDVCPKKCVNGCDENGTCTCPEPCQGEEVCNDYGVCEIPMCPPECPYDCDENRVCRPCDETCRFCNHDGLCRDGECEGCDHCDNEGVCHDEEPCYMYESCFWQDSCLLTDTSYHFKKTVWNISDDNLYLTYPYRTAEMEPQRMDGFCGYGTNPQTWCTIDWGDGTITDVVDEVVTGDEGDPCYGALNGWQTGYYHKYAAPGVYTVETNCNFNLYFYSHCDYHCEWMMEHQECDNVCFADNNICDILDRLVSYEE